MYAVVEWIDVPEFTQDTATALSLIETQLWEGYERAFKHNFNNEDCGYPVQLVAWELQMI
jgi:hypothetical protein